MQSPVLECFRSADAAVVLSRYFRRDDVSAFHYRYGPDSMRLGR